MLTLIPMLSACLCLATPLRVEGENHLGYVTLQVRDEPGYSAREVAAFLGDPAYLGSIRRGLRIGDRPDPALVGEASVSLLATQPGQEILCLQLAGASADAVREATRQLVEHLQSIVPTRRVAAQEDLIAAEARLAAALQAIEVRRSDLAALIDKCGADEPTRRLATLRDGITRGRQDIDDLELRVAEFTALRDYLVVAIKQLSTNNPEVDELPEQVAQAELQVESLSARIKSDHPSLVTAKQQLAKLQAELAEQITAPTAVDVELARAHREFDDLSATMKPGHPQLAKVQARLADLHAAAAVRPTGAISQQRFELEHELFERERELTQARSRLVSLKSRIDELQREARAMAILEGQWREVTQAHDVAQRDVVLATEALGEARQASRRVLAGVWLQVIAGPTFVDP